MGIPAACPRCGRCRLENVRVENRGVFWEHPDNIFWQHRVVRHESLRVVLHGDAEFEARDVTIKVWVVTVHLWVVTVRVWVVTAYV